MRQQQRLVADIGRVMPRPIDLKRPPLPAAIAARQEMDAAASQHFGHRQRHGGLAGAAGYQIADADDRNPRMHRTVDAIRARPSAANSDPAGLSRRAALPGGAYQNAGAFMGSRYSGIGQVGARASSTASTTRRFRSATSRAAAPNRDLSAPSVSSRPTA